MKYNYKFQNLLNYKSTVENFKKSEYGKALTIFNQEEQNLIKIENEKSRIINIIDNQNNINIRELRLYNNYLGQISKEVENQEQVVEESKINVSNAQAHLMRAMQEKKVFEKLKEKHFKEFLVEEKRKEDKVIDEIVTFKTRTQ